jgi:hypothetical protein
MTNSNPNNGAASSYQTASSLAVSGGCGGGRFGDGDNSYPDKKGPGGGGGGGVANGREATPASRVPAPRQQQSEEDGAGKERQPGAIDGMDPVTGGGLWPGNHQQQQQRSPSQPYLQQQRPQLQPQPSEVSSDVLVFGGGVDAGAQAVEPMAIG